MSSKIKPEQLIEEAVGKVSRRGNLMERDELESEAWIVWLERLSTSPYSYSQCVSILVRELKTILRTERATLMYFRGNFVYTPAMVRAYMENVVWDDITECADVDARLDLQGSIDKLPCGQQKALFKRYGLKDTKLSKAEKVNVSRAVEMVTIRLNQQYNQEVPSESSMEGVDW